MPEATTSPEIPPPEFHVPRRIRTRGLAVGCALVVVIGLGAVSYWEIATSRYRVIGPVDPKTGYQIEYTVSSQYQKRHVQGGVLSWLFAESDVFSPNPPPKAIEWIRAHMLHMMANTSHPGWNDLNIETVVQTSVSKGSVFKAVIDGQGNPELFYINAGSTDLVSEHLVISDFRATWYTINGFMRSDANLRVNVLLINDRDRSATYEFWGCYDPSHSTSVAEELMKIRNSIRITKVK